MLNPDCPQFIVSLVRDRTMQWADKKNSRRGLSGLLHFILQTPRVSIPWSHVTQYSHCDFEQIACRGDIIGKWGVTDLGEVIPIDPNASPPPDALLEITKGMVFDFAIAEDRSRFIIVETDIDDHVTRAIHDIK